MGTYFVYQENDWYHFVLQLLMASNWGLQIGDSFNGPIWSISVEVLVYGIFFLSLRYISGSVALLASLALGAALVQILKISTHPLFSCLMFFYLGCLTAAAYQRLKTSATARRLASAGAIAAILAMTVASLYLPIKAKYFLVVVSPALIYLCVTHIRATAFNSRWLIPAGNMTYSSYLLHVPLQIVVVSVCAYAGIRLPVYNPACLLAYIAITLLLSAWSYQYLEMPAQDWLRKRLLRRSPAVVRSPV
jgi:peptidoglycan/LPS O-acetylase OafA/YrhL